MKILLLSLLMFAFLGNVHAEEVDVDVNNLLILTDSNIRSLAILLDQVKEKPKSPSSGGAQSDSIEVNHSRKDSSSIQINSNPMDEIKKRDLINLSIVGIIQEVARTECKSYSCGNHPCVDFSDYEVFQQPLAKIGNTHFIAQKDLHFEEGEGGSKKITVSTQNSLTLPIRDSIEQFNKWKGSKEYKNFKKEHPNHEALNGPTGLFFSKLTCTDDRNESFQVKNQGKKIDALLNPNQTLNQYSTQLSSSGDFDQLVPCGQVIGKSAVEKITHQLNKHPIISAAIYSIVEVALNLAPVTVGLVTVGPTAAIGAALVTKNTGMSAVQESLASRVRGILGYRYAIFESEPQKLYFANLKKLEFLESQYLPSRHLFSENNRGLIDQAFISLKYEMAKQRLDAINNKLKSDEQKAIQDRIHALIIPLCMGIYTQTVADDAGEKLEELVKKFNLDEEMEDQLNRMVENIDEISQGVDTKIYPHYYIRGASKSGKSELADQIAKLTSLPTYHMDARGKSVSDIELELDRLLLKSPVSNPIVIIDNMDELTGSDGDKRKQSYAWLAKTFENRESKKPELRSKEATDAILGSNPKIAVHLGSKIFNPNQRNEQITHDLKRVTFLLVGESELGTNGTPAEKAVREAFRLVHLPSANEETVRRKALAILAEEVKQYQLEISSSDEAMVKQIVKQGMNLKLSLPMINQVVLSYTKYLRNKKELANGVKSKYKRKSNPFDINEEFKPYLHLSPVKPQSSPSESPEGPLEESQGSPSSLKSRAQPIGGLEDIDPVEKLHRSSSDTTLHAD